MSAVRAWASASLSAVLGFVLTASGCGTEAVGIDDCRDIEKARCAAGKTCGIVEDVAACERFYRDQCLHGLAVKPPANAVVERCVGTIRAAGNCAAGGADTPLAQCPNVTVSAPSLLRACDVVLTPEKTGECAFLLAEPEPMTFPDGGTSAETGNGGAGGAPAEGPDGGGLL